MAICAFPECGHVTASGRTPYCAAHYRQAFFGKELTPVVRRRGAPALCTFDGCGRKYYAGGWCRPHHRAWLAGEDLKPILASRDERAREAWQRLSSSEREARSSMATSTERAEHVPAKRPNTSAHNWWNSGEGPKFKDKSCRGCGRIFAPNGGRQLYCTPACYLENAQGMKYGKSAVELSEMFEAQGRVCAICRQDKKMHVDHDHANGKVRGLLCISCNTALGKFDESIERLQAAIDYLRRTSV